MKRTATFLAVALSGLVFTPQSNAGLWWQEAEEAECERESQLMKFLTRLNGIPAFVVKCPGTEISVMDRLHNPGCVEIKCEKCGEEKDWLCRQVYIRCCTKVECGCLNGEGCVCDLYGSCSCSAACTGRCGAGGGPGCTTDAAESVAPQVAPEANSKVPLAPATEGVQAGLRTESLSVPVLPSVSQLLHFEID